MVGIAEDSVRFTPSGRSQRFMRGLRPLVSVGPLFSGANASRHHLPRSIADKHLHFNHYDPSHNLLGTATLPTGAPEPTRRGKEFF